METNSTKTVVTKNYVKTTIMFKAELVSGDFEDNTMTFEVKGEMTIRAGKYVILSQEEYDSLIK
jgi:hypothetical protein